MREKYCIDNIIFSPEFLREGKALYDNLYPSRIIIGDKSKSGEKFATLLKNAALKQNIEIMYMNPTEAEAVKLFANTYLALRVAFFNELDTYAEIRKMNTKDIIDGVCCDSRIENYYNNPSFGYGGYCLPKDTKQLKSNYESVPENLISAIINSNKTRKDYIVERIMEKRPKIIGIYKLTMLKCRNVNVIIYEPNINSSRYFEECQIVNDIKEFKYMSEVILANRYNKILDNVKYKTYTRDIFGID